MEIAEGTGPACVLPLSFSWQGSLQARDALVQLEEEFKCIFDHDPVHGRVRDCGVGMIVPADGEPLQDSHRGFAHPESPAEMDPVLGGFVFEPPFSVRGGTHLKGARGNPAEREGDSAHAEGGMDPEFVLSENFRPRRLGHRMLSHIMAG